MRAHARMDDIHSTCCIVTRGDTMGATRWHAAHLRKNLLRKSKNERKRKKEEEEKIRALNDPTKKQRCAEQMWAQVSQLYNVVFL